MSSSRTILVATLVSAMVGACGDKTSTSNSATATADEPKSTATSSSPSSSGATTTTSGSASPVADADTAAPAGSDDKPPPAAPPAAVPPDAVLLDNGEHRVALTVEPSGKTKVAAFTKDDKPIELDKIDGQVQSGEGEPVELNPGTEGLEAELPKLEPGLTHIEVDLKIDGKKFEESVEVPEGGTKALNAEPPKAECSAPEGAKGPNGGNVEVLGGKCFEIVFEEDSNDIRVYCLGNKLEQIECPAGTAVTLNIDEGTKK